MKTLLLIFALSASQCFGFIIPTIQPEVLTYRSNIVANSSSISGPTLMAVNRMVTRLKLNDLWSRIYCLSPCAGNDFTAARTRLIYPSGTNALEFYYSVFTYSEASGMSGNGSAYIDTFFNPSAIGASVTNFGVWTFVRTTNVSGGSSEFTLGCQAAGNTSTVLMGWMDGGSKETGTIAASSSTEYPTGSATALTGWLGVQTRGSRSQQFYRNGVAVSSANTATGLFANQNIYRFGFNNNGTAAGLTDRTLSSYAITQGVDPVVFSAIITSFEAELGRAL